MNNIKRFFGVFLLMVMLAASKSSANPEMVEEESDIVVADICTTVSVSDYVDKYLVRLEKNVPSLVPLKEDFSYNYVVTTKDKIKKVIIEDQIPSGSTYVSSNPTAQIDEDKVIWTLYNLEKGESISLELVVNASSVSDFTNCATIEAYPEACTTTTVGVPLLSIKKTTALESFLTGTDVPWSLTLTNSGNVCAKNVVIADSFSEGLTDVDGNNEQVIEIGVLAPGESREINTNTTAVKAGKYCSEVSVTGLNIEVIEDKFCFVVLEKGIEITQEGPEKQFVGKRATYVITVTNTGDVSFDDVVVTNIPPVGSKLLAAEGAEISKKAAVWTTDMNAGEQKTFEVDLLVNKDGSYCNEASVSIDDSGLNRSASACTEWRGYPALLIEVIDTQDPIIVGDKSTYIIQVANQGTAADTNVTLDIKIPEGLSIVSASGATEASVEGNDISFAPYPVLNAKEIVEFRVVVKAVDTGDLRFKAQINSDLLKSPVPEEESTQVY